MSVVKCPVGYTAPIFGLVFLLIQNDSFYVLITGFTNVLNEKYHFKNKLKCEIKHSVYFLNNNDNDQLITN